MSIRPIDFNGMIQNTQEMSHTKSVESQRPVVEQEFVTTEIQNEVEVSVTQVHEQSDTTENNELDANANGGNEYSAQRRKRDKDKKKKQKVSDGAVKKKNTMGGFDITI